MFKTLGLFATSQCPDTSCNRPRCFFAHGENIRTSSAPGVVSGPSKARAKGGNSKNSVGGGSKDGAVLNAARGVSDVPLIPRSEAAQSLVNKVTTPLPKTGRSPAKPAPRPADPITPGSPQPQSLPTNLKNSPQPWADRQKGLQTLFTQYSKLYSTIPAESVQLARRSALEQENETSAASANLKAYKSAIHHAAVSISRRPHPDSVAHPSIGTVRESRIAFAEAEKRRASRLTRDRVERYCLPVKQFPIWRYPDPTDSSLGSGGGEDPSAEGTTQTCSRCKIPFSVLSVNPESRFGECRFHYGRTAPELIEGRRKWIHSCCKRERGEVGCEDGVHVFTDGEDDAALARRVGYRNVKQVRDGEETEGVDVVGMDCEMICTTAGISLGRVTVVDEEGAVLLDELVRQTVPILDLNTRFSGIRPGELDSAVMDLEAVRAAACAFIGHNTIIVGHGLENDLRALRLIHDKVIDTAVVFPHDKGPPFRRALRDMLVVDASHQSIADRIWSVKEKLGYFIQDRTADLGHSSAVDARAALEVLKWKVREDAI
ncbi:MAG: RNA exonuclease 3 [Tremellales sp. Tagirdzhanova-0007]|nr:MAG: RNA exonuclease 3 [Tremellales sp. Tagirdzhanova-0007]